MRFDRTVSRKSSSSRHRLNLLQNIDNVFRHFSAGSYASFTNAGVRGALPRAWRLLHEFEYLAPVVMTPLLLYSDDSSILSPRYAALNLLLDCCS
jgi:hypothetical protein